MKCEEELRVFVRTQVIRKVDYATAFARACSPFGELMNFENKFDYLWDHYHDLRSLQD